MAGEKLAHSVDFSPVLQISELIQTESVKIYDRFGNDVTSTILVAASTGHTDSEISYSVQSGDPGEHYWLHVLATLNTGEIIGQRLQMTIAEP